ncbi:MAG: alpha-E domain-containing protein [Hyphomonadaceae bacterium]|nr:alpha-E domain-containing protein [Hyphomonadaceae bacterium]
MLARTAESVYWLARYIERMDNVARLIEAAQRMAGLSSQTEEWRSALTAAGCDVGYAAKYDTVTSANAAMYLGVDPDNPSSILSSLEKARANARSVRTALTRDMWEAVNGAWLESRRLDMKALVLEHLPETLDWVKTMTTRFLGAYSSTMLRNEIYFFTRLGTFLERADNTARILDVKYHVLLPSYSGVGGLLDYYQWTSILQAVSATRAYHWVYRSEVFPGNVADLLILKPEMPRSLRACYDQIADALELLQDSYGGLAGEPHRLAGALAAQLRYGRIDDIMKAGLHEYLTQMIERTASLGAEIERFYMR